MLNVTGRFAPTPSGRMHLGNAFCSLLSWLSAKSQGGKIILRIEDLDTIRAPRSYAVLLEEDFRWLGLCWDEGGLEDSSGESFCQSERSEIYLHYFHMLEEKGLIYPCFCSRAELHAAEAPHMSDGRYLYTGKCSRLTPEEVREKSRVKKPAWRVRVPDETIRFEDMHCGWKQENLRTECGDFVLRRADGVFAYQLAAAVDDALMGVTEVVRGNDLLFSTPRQMWLQRTLGLPSPRYGHIPLLTAPDGRRLSKRDGDLDFGAIRERFSGPETVIGLLAYMAGLTDRPEPVKAAELISLFSWDKIPDGEVRLSQEDLQMIAGNT